MTAGKVSLDRKIELPMEVLGENQSTVSVKAVLDTGFNGFLTLPNDLLESVNALIVGGRIAELGDGSRVELDVYRIKVNWLGKPCVVLALRAESQPLLGMSMLWGSRVSFDAVDGGVLTIGKIA